MRGKRFTLPRLLLCSACAFASSAISGRVLDPQGHLVAGAAVRLAIKILPEAFAADPDRMARFTREAQVLVNDCC
jgi:hypothetical protein